MCSNATNEKSAVVSPWLTVQGAAEYLSVSPGTVRNWVSEHYVPFVRRGRVVRFDRRQLDQWLSRGACQGRARRAPDTGRHSNDEADAQQGGLEHACQKN